MSINMEQAMTPVEALGEGFRLIMSPQASLNGLREEMLKRNKARAQIVSRLAQVNSAAPTSTPNSSR